MGGALGSPETFTGANRTFSNGMRLVQQSTMRSIVTGVAGHLPRHAKDGRRTGSKSQKSQQPL
jgi:hypothetical protein